MILLHNCFNIFFLRGLASFRAGISTRTQIQRLNRNVLVSLHDDTVTEEKVRMNILANPHTLFLASTNATVEKIHEYVINALFTKGDVIRYIINGLHIPMPIYKNI